jgi:uncharacterized protein YnzC (UPF0291/DUF896 family)
LLSIHIQRINELARKQKSVGLTEAEKLEQAQLRKQYIENFKTSLRLQLEAIEFVDDEGKKV